MIKKLSIILFIVMFASVSFAASVTFEWDTNDEPDLVGYRLYQRLENGMYDFSATPSFEVLVANPDFDHTGDRCQWTLENVPDGTYYWVLTAFDSQNESGPSNEVSTTIDTTAPGAPSTLTIKVVVKVDIE